MMAQLLKQRSKEKNYAFQNHLHRICQNPITAFNFAITEARKAYFIFFLNFQISDPTLEG